MKERGAARELGRALAVLVPALLAGAVVFAIGSSGNGGTAPASTVETSIHRRDLGRPPTGAPLVAAPLPGRRAPQAATGARAPMPVRLRIPALGIDAHVRPVGASPAGIDVPPVDRVGWFDGGPRPGEPGRTVLVGHLDSYKGPAIFARLPSAKPGQLIRVTDGRGDDRLYRVAGSINVAKAKFPARQVYMPTEDSTIALITCGGRFDKATGHYENSIIVFASLA